MIGAPIFAPTTETTIAPTTVTTTTEGLNTTTIGNEIKMLSWIRLKEKLIISALFLDLQKVNFFFIV